MTSTRDRALSIAAKVGLSAEELTKPCEDRFFALLANFIHPWRLVFSSLLGKVDLDDIDEENQSRSEQDKRVAALRKWKAREGREATYGVLLGAILDCGKVDQAELLCEQVALQSHSEAQSAQNGGYLINYRLYKKNSCARLGKTLGVSVLSSIIIIICPIPVEIKIIGAG
jgi:hypothetical protein